MPTSTSPPLTPASPTYDLAPIPVDASPRYTMQAVGASLDFAGARVHVEFAADGANYRVLPDVYLGEDRSTASFNLEGDGSVRLRLYSPANSDASVSVKVNVVQ